MTDQQNEWTPIQVAAVRAAIINSMSQNDEDANKILCSYEDQLRRDVVESTEVRIATNLMHEITTKELSVKEIQEYLSRYIDELDKLIVCTNCAKYMVERKDFIIKFDTQIKRLDKLELQMKWWKADFGKWLNTWGTFGEKTITHTGTYADGFKEAFREVNKKFKELTELRATRLTAVNLDSQASLSNQTLGEK